MHLKWMEIRKHALTLFARGTKGRSKVELEAHPTEAYPWSHDHKPRDAYLWPGLTSLTPANHCDGSSTCAWYGSNQDCSKFWCSLQLHIEHHIQSRAECPGIEHQKLWPSCHWGDRSGAEARLWWSATEGATLWFQHWPQRKHPW